MITITDKALEELTQQDKDIFTLHAKGYSAAAIAKKLKLSSRTIENRTLKVTAKFKAKNKTEVACMLVDKGVISIVDKKKK